MDTAFLSRTRRASLVLSALAFLLFSYYSGAAWGLGFLLGSLWSIANLYLLGHLVVRSITLEVRSHTALVVLALVKFPLLYLAGYLILSLGTYPTLAPVLGFGLPFMVMVLKAAGRLLLGIEGPGPGREPDSAFGRR